MLILKCLLYPYLLYQNTCSQISIGETNHAGRSPDNSRTPREFRHLSNLKKNGSSRPVQPGSTSQRAESSTNTPAQSSKRPIDAITGASNDSKKRPLKRNRTGNSNLGPNIQGELNLHFYKMSFSLNQLLLRLCRIFRFLLI